MNPRLALLLAAALAAGCDYSEQVGSRWTTSAMLTPESGGTITVTAAESPSLAGATLTVPPQALAEPTLIGVCPGAALATGDLSQASESVEWDPADAGLLLPAQFSIPAQLPPGHDPDDVFVLALGPAGVEVLAEPQVQFDPHGGSIQFSVAYLGTFQAAVGNACRDHDDCAPGEECQDGECRPGTGGPPDGGPPHR